MKKAALRLGLGRLGGSRHIPPASVAAPADTAMCPSAPLAGEMSKLLDQMRDIGAELIEI
jgi:hypothetical protein